MQVMVRLVQIAAWAVPREGGVIPIEISPGVWFVWVTGKAYFGV